MGCALSKIETLEIDVSITPAFSNEIGGEIAILTQFPITCEWRQNNNTALLNLSNDRLTAKNVKPGVYQILCCNSKGERKTITAEVKKIPILIIDCYDITDASNDMARDGVITAKISNINNVKNIQYLWTSGVITTEPILYDVSPGTYCISIISCDKIPIGYYHGCSPAIVRVKSEQQCLIFPS